MEVRRSEQIPVADWLSRLHQEGTTTKKDDDLSVCFQNNMEIMSDVLSAALVARETAKDPKLAKVTEYIHNLSLIHI